MKVYIVTFYVNYLGHNIEICVFILESVGTYLMKSESDIRLKFNNLLDFLSRLKESIIAYLVIYFIEENISSKLMTALDQAF